MKTFVLSLLAEQDLEQIRDYIARDNPDASDRVLEKIRDAIRTLVSMPGIGHHRDDLPDFLRVWTVYSYLIIYKPDSDPLEIVRIIHGMMNIPDIF